MNRSIPKQPEQSVEMNCIMESKMTAITSASPNLRVALQQANKILFEREYIVVAKNEKASPKEPVFLQLKYPDGRTRNVGITHLVHLRGSDWNDRPIEEIARTTEEVTKAIIVRINLFFDAESRQLYIDENGTIFNFNKIPLEVHANNTFSVKDIQVTYEGSALLLTRIKSESIVEFRQRENGHVELFDAIDQRKGKGIFIDTVGKIYRA
jgi:hypothetical protein